MSIGGELKRALLKVSERARNERIRSEKNYRLVSQGDQSLSEMYKEIVEMTKKVQLVQDECVEIKRENVMYQRKIKSLDDEIQKQTAYAENLKRLKDDIENENALSKKEREDELNVHLDEKKRLTAAIEEQMKQIQQLLAENEDKFEFIHQQVNTISSRNQGYQKNKQLIKRDIYEREDEHYKGLCKTLLIRGLLASQTNFKMINRLKEEKESLKKQFTRSVKDLNKALYQADHCKSEILLRFDSHYDQDNKDELLKLITSTFNMLITIGFTNYWRAIGEMTKRKMELWSTKEQSGKPVEFHTPFSRIVISFPNDDSSFDDRYAFKRSKNNSAEATVRTNYNIIKKNDGFQSLQLE